MTLGLMRPCLSCGKPGEGSRCEACAAEQAAAVRQRDYARERLLYGSRRWRNLSLRARHLQPFCLHCGRTDQLSTHHTGEALARVERGLSIDLRHVIVLCTSCNSKLGSPDHPNVR